MILLIAGFSPPNPLMGEDAAFWGGEESGLFSIKSAYKSLSSNEWQAQSNCWQKVWKLQVPQRVRTFMWLAMKQVLLKNSVRFKRHMAPNPWCDLSAGVEESIIHVL